MGTRTWSKLSSFSRASSTYLWRNQSDCSKETKDRKKTNKHLRNAPYIYTLVWHVRVHKHVPPSGAILGEGWREEMASWSFLGFAVSSVFITLPTVADTSEFDSDISDEEEDCEASHINCFSWASSISSIVCSEESDSVLYWWPMETRATWRFGCDHYGSGFLLNSVYSVEGQKRCRSFICYFL